MWNLKKKKRYKRRFWSTTVRVSLTSYQEGEPENASSVARSPPGGAQAGEQTNPGGEHHLSDPWASCFLWSWTQMPCLGPRCRRLAAGPAVWGRPTPVDTALLPWVILTSHPRAPSPGLFSRGCPNTAQWLKHKCTASHVLEGRCWQGRGPSEGGEKGRAPGLAPSRSYVPCSSLHTGLSLCGSVPTFPLVLGIPVTLEWVGAHPAPAWPYFMKSHLQEPHFQMRSHRG